MKIVGDEYRRLVMSIALSIRRPAHIDIRDLYAYGNIGLLEAASRYDENSGCQFTTFATVRIRGAILDGMRSLGWIDRKAQRHFGDMSKTAIVYDLSSMKELRSESAMADDECISKEHLSKAFSRLTEKESDILFWRYWMEESYSDIAKRMRCSKPWALRMCQIAINKCARSIE